MLYQVTSVTSNSATLQLGVVHQTPLSMGFSRQEYRSGLPCPSPGDLSDPKIEPESLKSPALVYSVVKTKTKNKQTNKKKTELSLALIFSLTNISLP